MSKILTDDIIPKLKQEVEESCIKPGDSIAINVVCVGMGNNSKTRVRVFLPINRSLNLVNSVRFVGTTVYSIQWDAPWENIHWGGASSSTIESDSISIVPTGLILRVTFSSDITNTPNMYSCGFCALDGTLEFE